MFLILICICTDIGGFIFGKIIGGKKFTKISPNKTYAGIIGSFIIPLIFGYLYNAIYSEILVLKINIFLLIIFISFISQCGDLMISFFKRKAKIKDTGSILPGHGGILDRIDGMLLALPIGVILFNYCMMRDIYLLGSTGSIGLSTLNIVRNNKKKFIIKLLSTNKNILKIYNQALEFNVKKIIIFNKPLYLKHKKKFEKKNIKVFFNIEDAFKGQKKKVFLTINAISGIDGLEPTIKIIKFTKNLAIANKESIICGWKFIKKTLIRNNTNFIPLDSEHFSIWSILKNEDKKI